MCHILDKQQLLLLILITGVFRCRCLLLPRNSLLLLQLQRNSLLLLLLPRRFLEVVGVAIWSYSENVQDLQQPF